MRQLWSKIERMLASRRELGSELEQEIDAHVQFLMDKNLERVSATIPHIRRK